MTLKSSLFLRRLDHCTLPAFGMLVRHMSPNVVSTKKTVPVFNYYERGVVFSKTVSLLAPKSSTKLARQRHQTLIIGVTVFHFKPHW